MTLRAYFEDQNLSDENSQKNYNCTPCFVPEVSEQEINYAMRIQINPTIKTEGRGRKKGFFD